MQQTGRSSSLGNRCCREGAGGREEAEGEGRYLAVSAAWVKGCSILLNPRIVASNEAFLRMNLFKIIVLSPISVGSMNHSPQGSFAKGNHH